MAARRRLSSETRQQYKDNLRAEESLIRQERRSPGNMLYVAQVVNPETMKIVVNNGPARRVNTPEGRMYLTGEEFVKYLQNKLANAGNARAEQLQAA